MKVVIIGAGAWGSALAITLANAGDHELCIYGNNTQVIEEIQQQRTNERYLPGVSFDKRITATGDLRQAVDKVDVIILAIPVAAHEEVGHQLISLLGAGYQHKILITAKGFSQGKYFLLHDLIKSHFPNAIIGVISGPNFALDVAKNYPIASSIAAINLKDAKDLAALFMNKNMRTYPNDDLIGTLLCGGLKNIYAIGAGIIHEMGMSASTKAFYISRALTEMGRIIKYYNGDTLTLLTPAGIGDLEMCCNNIQSRNMRYGANLIKERQKTTDDKGAVLIEGVNSLHNAYKYFCNLDTPIIDGLHRIIVQKEDITAIIDGLLTRSMRIDTSPDEL